MEKKKLFAIILILVIVVLLILIIIFHETIFVQTIKLTFPDGCEEIYKNGVAVTPICSNGRMLQEQKNNPVYNFVPIINQT